MVVLLSAIMCKAAFLRIHRLLKMCAPLKKIAVFGLAGIKTYLCHRFTVLP